MGTTKLDPRQTKHISTDANGYMIFDFTDAIIAVKGIGFSHQAVSANGAATIMGDIAKPVGIPTGYVCLFNVANTTNSGECIWNMNSTNTSLYLRSSTVAIAAGSGTLSLMFIWAK